MISFDTLAQASLSKVIDDGLKRVLTPKEYKNETLKKILADHLIFLSGRG